MSLLDTVHSLVAMADTFTAQQGFQASVTHRAFLASSGDGETTYVDTARMAVVVKKQKLVKTPSGEMKMSQASVTFLDPAVTVGEFDLIVLPGGMSGSVIATESFIGGDGVGVLTEVYLG